MQGATFSKTRIAPTPSGYLHLGNAYSFALTAALAELYGARILLRIDDLDRDRMRPAYVADVFDTLHFLGISWHEGPAGANAFPDWSQTQRLPHYTALLQQLRDDGRLFACNCSRTMLKGAAYSGACRDKHLPLDQPDVAWRLRTDARAPVRVRTLSGTTETFLPAAMQDFIVRKKDGFPAYQLASVADDLHFGIDLIVRGQDLWDSTLAQLYLAQLLPGNRFPETVFHHHPLLMESGDKKLSKSDGATSIRYLHESGATREDVWSKIAAMTGHPQRITDYRELAALALQKKG
ncbi:glutamate--tRNA ligase family protein [Chitinophaga lutea]